MAAELLSFWEATPFSSPTFLMGSVSLALGSAENWGSLTLGQAAAAVPVQVPCGHWEFCQ